MRQYIFALIGVLCVICESCDKAEVKSFHEQPLLSHIDLDIYPLDYPNNQLAPTIVFIHGGTWIGGDKSHWGHKQIQTFKNNQFLSISINYPTKYKHPAHILSISKTLQWIQDSVSHYGGDPHKIILIGHSAGAHLAALAVTNQKYISENTNFALSNIKLVCMIDAGSYLTLSNGYPDAFYANAFYQAAGSSLKDWQDFTPGNHISPTKNIPPFFLIYSNDPYRDNANQLFCQKLTTNGITTICRKISNTSSHYEMLYNFPTYTIEDSIAIMQTILTFITK